MAKTEKTQVAIIGSGPAGLMLGALLANAGIDSIILDRQSRQHIEGRIRAGILEWGTVEAMVEAGAGDRMHTEGLPHDGFDIAFDGDRFRIDLKGLTNKQVMVYGQTELTRDLIDKRTNDHLEIVFSADNVQPLELSTSAPRVTYEKDGEAHEISCDYVAGCDGFHGICRRSIPGDVVKTFERVYPFGWLGVLVEQPPVSHELIYANNQRGFALCSMRSETRSRYYVQCPLEDTVDDWSDKRFWDELSVRIGSDAASNLKTGDSFEKSIAPLRSFVAEPMRHGSMFLAGDAAHIVPPTGAKGLNLAIADVQMLARALTASLKSNDDTWIDRYSVDCLRRVWKVERFSWFMSAMLHQFPENSPFENRMQRAEFDHITGSETAARSLAENYVGLPLD
ncbi:MAG: 4-hydroxybenzoate 3-monooxygenase [Boseongicola sp.]